MISIQVLAPISSSLIETFGDSFSRVFLDLDNSVEIPMTKAMDRDDITNVTQEAALSFSLPGTSRNKAILEQFSPEAINRNTDVIQVEVIQDGERLPLTGAAVLGSDENFLEFELFGDSYLDELNFPLRDLDLGTFEYTAANIEAAWQTRAGIAKPLPCHFGGFNNPGQIGPKDLRFFFSVWGVLEKIFQKISWCIEGQHYQIGYGQHAYAYLSAENWHFYREKQNEAFVHLNIASSRSQPASVDFILFDEVYDPFDTYNNPFFLDQYRYGTSGANTITELQIQFRDFIVELPPSPQGQNAYSFVIGIQKLRGNQVTQVHAEIVTGSTDQTTTHTINFDYIDGDAFAGVDRYRFFLSYSNINGDGTLFSTYNIRSGDVFIRPDPPHLVEGDTIHLADLLSDKISALDFFTAAVELINGRVVTDVAQHKVFVFPPYTYTAGTTTIEGFHKTHLSPLDLRANTITDLTSWDDKTKTQERYRTYKFQDTSDKFLTNDSLFNREVDLGAGVATEPKKIENSLFQSSGEIAATAAEVGGVGDIPLIALWDDGSESGEISKDIKPRIAIYYGEIQSNTWNWNGAERTTLPYLSQVARQTLPTTNTIFVPITYSGFVNDIFTLFFERDLKSAQQGITYEVILTGDLYNKIDFRQTILIKGATSDLELQPIAVRDYLPKVPLLVEARLI